MQMLDPAGVEPNSDQPVSGACHDDASAAPRKAMPRRPDRVSGDDPVPDVELGWLIEGRRRRQRSPLCCDRSPAARCDVLPGGHGCNGVPRAASAPGGGAPRSWPASGPRVDRTARGACAATAGWRTTGGRLVRASNTPAATSSTRAPSSAKLIPIQPHVLIPSPPQLLSTDPRSLDGSAPPRFEWPHVSADGHVGAPGVGPRGRVRPPGRGRGGRLRRSLAVGTSAGLASGRHEHRAVAPHLDGRSTTGSHAHRVTVRMIPQGTG